VFSGIYLLDPDVLTALPVSLMCMYFASWTTSLLGDPKYAVAVGDSTCGGNCTSYFLPSGIETARRVSDYLNLTLLEGGLFQEGDTIEIANAPGLLLDFKALDSTFTFDWENECQVYGAQMNDSLQLCIRQVDSSIAVGESTLVSGVGLNQVLMHPAGWKACPTSLFKYQNCQKNTTWLGSPLVTKILLATYSQNATTAYQQVGSAILNTNRVSEPVLSPLRATDFQATWDHILQPQPSTDPDSLTMINSLTISLSWVIRLYDDFFPDDHQTPVTYLENFLAIPLQFMVTTVQFANYTFNMTEPLFALPANMTTTAVSGTSTQRLIGQPWVVWTFIAVGGFLTACAGAMLVWIVAQPRQPQPGSGVPEVAMLERAGDGYEQWSQLQGQHDQAAPPGEPTKDSMEVDSATQSYSDGPQEDGLSNGIQTLEEFVKSEHLPGLSLWALALRLRRRRVWLWPSSDPESERLLLCVEPAGRSGRRDPDLVMS
jgi:hypothetical protein